MEMKKIKIENYKTTQIKYEIELSGRKLVDKKLKD